MSSNEISPRLDFDRRRKTNQTTVSICLHCLRTVANCSDEMRWRQKRLNTFARSGKRNYRGCGPATTPQAPGLMFELLENAPRNRKFNRLTFQTRNICAGNSAGRSST